MTLLTARRLAVVGTLSPLGRRLVARLAEHGARVVGIDHVADSPAAELEQHLVADMSDAQAAENGLRAAVEHLGGLDGIVLGAAVQRGGRVWETDEETWRAVLTGTLDTAFHGMRSGLRLLGRGGSLVAISSVNAVLAHPANAAYAAAKGAVDTLVRQASLDAAPRGIRVNAVAPALVDGPAEATGGYPWGSTPTSEHVADAVAFLLSELAGGITGAVLPVDGGLSITSPATFARPALRAKLEEGAAP